METKDKRVSVEGAQALYDDVRDRLNEKSDLILKTVEGPAGILSFDDGADGLPLKELKVGIEPVQDLHGYDHPWVGGAGKNLCPIDHVDFNPVATWVSLENANANTSTNGTKIHLKAGTWFLRLFETSNVNTFQLFDASGNALLNGSSGSFTLNSEQDTCFRVKVTDTTTAVKFKIQLEAGSMGTAWEPYSNICPISGFDHAEVTRYGENICPSNESFLDYAIKDDGTSGTNSDYCHTPLIPVKNSKTYIFTGDSITGTELLFRRIHFYDSDGTWIKQKERILPANNKIATVVTIEEGVSYVALSLIDTDSNIVFALADVYSVSFPASAGTVYGGELTINKDGSGVLVVDKALKNISDINWQLDDNTAGRFIATVSDMKPCPDSVIVYAGTDLISSHYPYSALSKTNMPDGTMRYNEKDRKVLFIKNSAYSTAEAFKEAMSGATICYPLDTVITYALSAPAVYTLLGKNRVYSDTGDIFSAIYYTDNLINYEFDQKADKASIIFQKDIESPASIVSLPDAADNAPVGLKVKIEPQQDLHGYSKPWVGGAGKNLYGGTTGEIFDLPRTLAANTDVVVSFTRSGEGQVTVNVYKTGETTRYDFRTLTGNQRSFTLDQDTARVMLICAEGVTISNVQLELGSTPTSYEPYENICPISGFDHAEVRRTGKNIWDEEVESGGITTVNGSDTTTSGFYRSKNYIRVLPNTSYYCNSPKRIAGFFYDKYKNCIDYNTSISENGLFTTPSNAKYMRFRNYTQNDWDPATDKVSIGYPSKDYAYHAYVGQTYSITFPTSAGIVYGGTLTLNQDGTGTLVVDRKEFAVPTITEFTGTSSSGSYKYVRAIFGHNEIDQTVDTNNVLSECLVSTNYSASRIPWSCYSVNSGANGGSIIVFADTNTTVEEYNSKVAGTKLVAKLATTVSYTLSIDQVQSLLGLNHIWSNTGDILSVSYYTEAYAKFRDLNIATIDETLEIVQLYDEQG